jgi:hypothetical protein
MSYALRADDACGVRSWTREMSMSFGAGPQPCRSSGWRKPRRQGRRSPATLLAIIAVHMSRTEQAKRTLHIGSMWAGSRPSPGTISVWRWDYPAGSQSAVRRAADRERRGARDEIVVPSATPACPRRGFLNGVASGAGAYRRRRQSAPFSSDRPPLAVSSAALLGPCPLDSFLARGWQPAAPGSILSTSSEKCVGTKQPVSA